LIENEERGFPILQNDPSCSKEYQFNSARYSDFGSHGDESRSDLEVWVIEDEKVTVKFIMKVYHDFKQIMVEPHIWVSFQALRFGLEFNTTSEPY
jgi:hypothetical protein